MDRAVVFSLVCSNRTRQEESGTEDDPYKYEEELPYCENDGISSGVIRDLPGCFPVQPTLRTFFVREAGFDDPQRSP